MTVEVTDLITPLPYQVVAIDKLSKVEARLVGDEMGVGKTVTGIGLDFETRRLDPSRTRGLPTLIIPEKIGRDVWEYHLKAMGVPDSAICVIDTANKKPLLDALARERDYQSRPIGRQPQITYYVVHWDAINRVELLTEKTPSGKPRIRFAHVIADEVHLAKNRKALRSKALKAITTEYKTGLSGTPADDKPQDIWSVLNWLYPKKYRSYWRFFEKYVDYDTHPTMGYRIPKGPREDNLHDFHMEIEPFYIRRRLLEVVDIPEKIDPVMPPTLVQLTSAQRKAYRSMETTGLARLESGDLLSAPAVVAMLIRLQQMALGTVDYVMPELFQEEFDPETGDVDYDFPSLSITTPSPKLDAILNKIETNETDSFIVFSQFKSFVDLVERECNKKFGQGTAVKITGKVADRERQQAISTFQNGMARVFVGTIAAAGKTITLTKARHVIFADRSWNPSKNAQAVARAWRYGQGDVVRVHDIIALDTIDERFMKKVKRNGKWIYVPAEGRIEKIAKKASWVDALLNPVREDSL